MGAVARLGWQTHGGERYDARDDEGRPHAPSIAPRGYCRRQIGQGPSLGSRPNVTVTGPRTVVFFWTVSFTVTVMTTSAPSTCPVNWAGTVGPTAIGYARSM